MAVRISNLNPTARFNYVDANVQFADCSVVRTAADGVEEGFVVCVGKNPQGGFELFILAVTDEVQLA